MSHDRDALQMNVITNTPRVGEPNDPRRHAYDEGCGCDVCRREREPVVRQFASGANRDVDTNKLDFEGFVSPIALEAFGLYMHKNRHLRDGSVRDSDNWQKGIPLPVYMKSAWRHFNDWWRFHRQLPIKETPVEALCGLLFNLQGYLHEYLKAHPDELESFRNYVANIAKQNQTSKE
jgi:hypothetical protein